MLSIVFDLFLGISSGTRGDAWGRLQHRRAEIPGKCALEVLLDAF